MVARLAETTPDVVHVHNTFPMLGGSVLSACRDAGVPVVATLHNYKLLCASGDFFRDGHPCHDCGNGAVLPGLRHGCYRASRLATVPVAAGMLANRRLWRDVVSAYVFVSQAQRDLMRGLGLPARRVFVKHNFVGGQLLSDRAPEHLVTYIGRLDAAKGIPLLIESWDRSCPGVPARP